MNRLGLGRGVAVIDDGTVIYAAALPDGPIVVLEEGAAAIWVEACRGDRATIAERLVDGTDVPADEIRDNVEVFLERMIRAGLLREHPA
ncbi:MAG: PqqD family protein [Agromyces sp.]|nr:PqqD family protein [Agromyces sp.]